MTAEDRASVATAGRHGADARAFEDAYQELQHVVDELDAGGLGLEAAVRLFERGMQLAAECERIVAAAELRVTRVLPEELAPSPEEPR